MHTQVEILACFECGAEVDCTVRHNGFQAGSTSIGPPLFDCPRCSASVATGRKEWSQKNAIQKTVFVLGRLAWLAAGSGFVAGGLTGILRVMALQWNWIRPEQEVVFALVCFAVGTVLLSGIVVRNMVNEIRESVQRAASLESRERFTRANPFPGLFREAAADPIPGCSPDPTRAVG